MTPTTKRRKPETPASPPPAPRPKRADVARTVDEAFRNAAKRVMGLHAEIEDHFRDQAATDPLYACRWHAEAVAKALGGRKAWDAALLAYDEAEGDAEAKMRAVVNLATRTILRMAEYRPWDVNSTCQITNFLTRAEAVGNAGTWSSIREYATSNLQAIEGAEDTDAVDETTSATPQSV